MREPDPADKKTACTRRLAPLLFGLLLLLFAGRFTCTAADTADLTLTVTYEQTNARSILDMVNEFRTGEDAWYWNSSNTSKIVKTDLQELTYDYTLEAIAMQRAAEIAVSFSHNRPDGTDCFTCRINGTHSYAENLAAGQTSAQEAFLGWQESDEDYAGQSHRRAMLDSRYTCVGIACVCVGGCCYWVQEFGTGNSGAAKTPAKNTSAEVDMTVSAREVSPVSVGVSSASVLSVGVGKKIAVPTVTVKVNPIFGSTLSLTAKCTWKVSDNPCLSITNSGKKISGKHAGSKKIRTSVLGQKIYADIQVNLLENSTFTSDGLCYKVTSLSGRKGTVRVTGAKKANSTNLTIPAALREGNVNLRVTAIGSGAFSKMKKLKSVSIGRNVKTIGKDAFSCCTALKEVSGARAVTAIRSNAFYNCKSLLTLGNSAGKVKLSSVRKISDRAFARCSSITTLRISSSRLTAIGRKAFWGCRSLTSSAITSKKLSSIGKKAFYGCSKLKRFRIATKRLTKNSVESSAFQGLPSGCTFTVPSSKAEDYRKIFEARGARQFTIKES